MLRRVVRGGMVYFLHYDLIIINVLYTSLLHVNNVHIKLKYTTVHSQNLEKLLWYTKVSLSMN